MGGGLAVSPPGVLNPLTEVGQAPCLPPSISFTLTHMCRGTHTNTHTQNLVPGYLTIKLWLGASEPEPQPTLKQKPRMQTPLPQPSSGDPLPLKLSQLTQIHAGCGEAACSHSHGQLSQARLGLPPVKEGLVVLGPEARSWGGRVASHASLSARKGKGETESAYLI